MTDNKKNEVKLTASEKKEAAKKSRIAAKRALAESKNPAYIVCEKRSITSTIGLLGPGDKLKVDVIAGGQDSIDKLVDRGDIKKK